jgi:hypothetical protein
MGEILFSGGQAAGETDRFSPRLCNYHKLVYFQWITEWGRANYNANYPGSQPVGAVRGGNIFITGLSTSVVICAAERLFHTTNVTAGTARTSKIRKPGKERTHGATL